MMIRNLMAAAALTFMITSTARAADRIPTSTDEARALAGRTTVAQTISSANRAIIVTSSDQARALAARSTVTQPVASVPKAPFIASTTDEARGLTAPPTMVASVVSAKAKSFACQCPCEHHG